MNYFCYKNKQKNINIESLITKLLLIRAETFLVSTHKDQINETFDLSHGPWYFSLSLYFSPTMHYFHILNLFQLER
jgi:hypothetical protein